MKRSLITTTLLLLGAVLGASPAPAAELSGFVAAEGTFFFHEPLFDEQEEHAASLVFQPELYHEWEDGSSFTFVPFYRCDTADSQRSHFDIRELNVLCLRETWELRVGVAKVFWGVTEFVHLIDVINQIDLVENIDEEDRLGQPMVHFSAPREWGTLDLFLLPYFRERTFPGRKGRLRYELEVDTDHPDYESGAGQCHPDWAARYSHTIGDWDFGIYHFMGTNREPTFRPRLRNGRGVLTLYYEQINQTGLDVQLVAGEWLWKLEALHRTGQGEDFFAATGGFEYTFVGIVDTNADLGIVGEWAGDTRGDHATNPYENDVMAGLRLTVNDPQSTELLVGLIQDVDSSTRALKVEASRRLADNWRLTLEAWSFFGNPNNDPLASLRDDDYLRVTMAYYF